MSTTPVFKWDPSSGISIIDTNNSPDFPVQIPWDIVTKNDSFIIAGDGGVAVLIADSFVNLLDGRNEGARIWDIGIWDNKYFLSVGLDKNFMYQSIGHLIEWDGASGLKEYQSISDFMDSNPSIAVTQEYNGELYAGGSSDASIGGIMNDIMKWNGSNWVDVGGGIIASGATVIYDMEIYQGELYVAGQFEQQGSIKENHIARWDGVQWKSVGGGIQNDIFGYSVLRELHVHDGYLYVGGRFGGAGGVPAEGVARWDGNEWCGCVGNILETVETLTHYRDTLYIGGNFGVYTPQDSIYSLARFIGTEFADTCGSINVGIKTIAAQKKELVGYPNPVQETLTLKFPYTQLNEVAVFIYSSMGQLVREEKYTLVNQELKLNLNQLTSGMYFGEIQSSSHSFRFSFVKE